MKIVPLLKESLHPKKLKVFEAFGDVEVKLQNTFVFPGKYVSKSISQFIDLYKFWPLFG